MKPLSDFDPEKEFRCYICRTRNPIPAEGDHMCRSCEANNTTKDSKVLSTKPGSKAASALSSLKQQVSTSFTMPTTSGFTFGATTSATTSGFTFQPGVGSFTFGATTTPAKTDDEKKTEKADEDTDMGDNATDATTAQDDDKKTETTTKSNKRGRPSPKDDDVKDSDDEVQAPKQKVQKVTKEKAASAAAKAKETKPAKPAPAKAPESSDDEDDEDEDDEDEDDEEESESFEFERLDRLDSRYYRNSANVMLSKKKHSDIVHVQKAYTPVDVTSAPLFGRGKVLSFGTGDMAQLGLGVDIRERRFPAVLKALEEHNIVSIATGALHNLALTSKGEVYSWGCNDDGALGRRVANEVEEFSPGLVQGLEGRKIVQIGCGASHSLALDDTGTVFSWGAYRDLSGLIGFDEGEKRVYSAVPVPGLKGEIVVKIGCGESHSIVLTKSGRVYYWGDVFVGRRTSDRNKRVRLYPLPVTFGTSRAFLRDAQLDRKLKRDDIKIVDIFTGGYTCFAISETGLLWAWGPNNYSQTGIPRKYKDSDNVSQRLKEADMSVTVPTLVSYFAENNIKIVSGAASTQFTLFLSEDSTVYAVGRTVDGRLGQPRGYAFVNPDEQVTPLAIPKLTREYLSSAPSWEQKSDTFKQPYHDVFSSPSDDAVIGLACGEAHAVAITAKGRVFSWGGGYTLQLGNGEDRTEYEPYWVRSQQITTIPRVAVSAGCGAQHSVILTRSAIKIDGEEDESESETAEDAAQTADDAMTDDKNDTTDGNAKKKTVKEQKKKPAPKANPAEKKPAAKKPAAAAKKPATPVKKAPAVKKVAVKKVVKATKQTAEKPATPKKATTTKKPAAKAKAASPAPKKAATRQRGK